MSNNYNYLFGPVPSRRLGRSLGIDLIPFKTCTMNCRFCQLGDSACALSERKEYVPIDEVLAELNQWKVSDGRADHLTLAGSGEPTLHIRFGDVFRWAREHTEIATVLLTNGSLLYLPEVRRDAALADKVKVTLSAWNEESFRSIHNPAQGIRFDQLVTGERGFREEYSGELSVEVFIVEGMNSALSDVRKIAEVVHSVCPDRIDINTAVRPPADSRVQAVSEDQLKTIADVFGEKAVVTASFKKQGEQAQEVTEELLLGLIKRHPATAAQLAEQFGVSMDQVCEMLGKMTEAGVLLEECRDGVAYYFHRD